MILCLPILYFAFCHFQLKMWEGLSLVEHVQLVLVHCVFMDWDSQMMLVPLTKPGKTPSLFSTLVCL